MGVLVLGAVIVAVFVTIAVLSYQANKRRVAALAAFAASKGWQFTPGDPYNLPRRWDVDPFGNGYARRASNVMTGQVGGRPVVVFDYDYKEDSHDSDGKRQTTTHRYHVCVMRLPASLPALRVAPEGLLTRIGNALGFDDIELESEQFNRRYRVKARDRKFACDVLTPRTMELLLLGEPVPFQIVDSDILSAKSGRGSPADIIARTETLAGVVDGIPGFVWKDHGHDPKAWTA